LGHSRPARLLVRPEFVLRSPADQVNTPWAAMHAAAAPRQSVSPRRCALNRGDLIPVTALPKPYHRGLRDSSHRDFAAHLPHRPRPAYGPGSDVTTLSTATAPSLVAGVSRRPGSGSNLRHRYRLRSSSFGPAVAELRPRRRPQPCNLHTSPGATRRSRWPGPRPAPTRGPGRLAVTGRPWPSPLAAICRFDPSRAPTRSGLGRDPAAAPLPSAP